MVIGGGPASSVPQLFMLDLFALPWSWIWLSDIFRRERCPSRRPAQVEIFLFMLSNIKQTQTFGDTGMNAPTRPFGRAFFSELFIIFKGVNSHKGC